jgi:prepilin-type N-terminal cleavage/methylation domain-containing protein
MKRPRSQRGFTLIELMIVIMILSILVRISLPAFAGIRREAIAANAAGDFNTVRAAAVAQYEATGNYAADGASGVVPSGMAPFLPASYSFAKKDYQLDWENLAVADTSGGVVTSGQIVGITVAANDSLVARQILHMLGGNCTHWSVGNSSTFVMFSTLESQY